jgi:protein phosphatase
MFLKFDISAFTHVGTVRNMNQDHILVNGQLLNEGEVHLLEQEKCFCFVADGVGGNKGGDFASYFVLNRIKAEQDKLLIDAVQILKNINNKLIEDTSNDIKLKGCCTTLTGLLVQNDLFKIIHAGDSEIWLMRNDMFFKITNDQVLDETEKNSPITSYFGGIDNYLKLDSDISIHKSLIDDLFLICSDGLFKSLNQKIVKSILKADKDLETKAKKILENCLHAGAEDNISVILIQQTK